MRIAACIALFAAAGALAQDRDEFRSSAPITLTGGDALHRLTLPYEVYRDARKDLADIRIFNKQGAAVPLAFGGDPEPNREAPAALALPMFPISAAPNERLGNNLDVHVRSSPDGTLVSVRGRPKAQAKSRPVAWLLDASQVQKPIRALVFEWDVAPGTEVARVSVEASDDLKSWRTVATRSPIVRLEQGEQKLLQPKVEVGSLRARYLRISADPSSFNLRTVQAEPEEVVKPAARLARIAAATPGAKPGEYVFDLGARLPVEALRVVLPEANSVAPFTVSSREGESGDWRQAARATFYRLVRDGAEVESPPVEISRRAARYWSIRLDARSPGIGATPSLEVLWRPAQLVFVARGEPPFELGFGNPEARPAALAVGELIPGYEMRAELKLPEARVGAVKGVERRESLWRSVFGDAQPRRVVLWAALVAAVLALGLMAWRLRGQLQ